MTMLAVLDKIRQAGGSIRLAGDQTLKVSAPAGLLTNADRDLLAHHKTELLRLYGLSEEALERAAIVWADALTEEEINAALREFDRTCPYCGSTRSLAGVEFIWCLDCEGKIGDRIEPERIEPPPPTTRRRLIGNGFAPTRTKTPPPEICGTPWWQMPADPK